MSKHYSLFSPPSRLASRRDGRGPASAHRVKITPQGSAPRNPRACSKPGGVLERDGRGRAPMGRCSLSSTRRNEGLCMKEA
jgi:hypothetical protein